MTSRRAFLAQGSALGAVALLGCQSEEPRRAPSAIVRSERRVARVLAGMPTSDGAGVKLLRVIGQPALRNLDPFILLDRLHSDDPGAYLRGFPDHPHRGFETVSVMIEGNIRHRDSRGNHGLITGGGAQWMTAGRGLIHSEMPEQSAGLLSGFQLWVNLPAREKLCVPEYQDLAPARLAEEAIGAGGRARVISGAHSGLSGPVRARPTEATLLTLALEDETPFELDVPAGHTTFVFVYQGTASVGPDADATRVAAGSLAILGQGTRVRVQARGERAALLVAAGKPLHEPIAQRGPFVMNTEAELDQAFADYRAGLLDRG